jgi:prophage DNA circulation protein
MLRQLNDAIGILSSRVVNIEESVSTHLPSSIDELNERVFNLSDDVANNRSDIARDLASSQRLLELQVEKIDKDNRFLIDTVDEMKCSVESIEGRLSRPHRVEDNVSLITENESLRKENEKLENRNKALKEKVSLNTIAEIQMREELRRIQDDVTEATNRNKTLNENYEASQSMAKIYEERCKSLQAMIDRRNEIDAQREASRQEAARRGWVRRREASDSSRAEGRMDEETWKRARSEPF